LPRNNFAQATTVWSSPWSWWLPGLRPARTNPVARTIRRLAPVITATRRISVTSVSDRATTRSNTFGVGPGWADRTCLCGNQAVHGERCPEV